MKSVAGDASTGIAPAVKAAIQTIEAQHEDSAAFRARELRILGDTELLKRLKGKYPNDDPDSAALSPFMSLYYTNASECYARAVEVARDGQFVIMDYRRYVEWAHSATNWFALQGDAGNRGQAYVELSTLVKKLRRHRPHADFMRTDPFNKDPHWTPKQARHALRSREADTLTQLLRFAPTKKKWKYGFRAISLVYRYGDARARHRLMAAFRSNDHYNITVIVQAGAAG